MGKRNPHAVAARGRKAGPHTGKKKPEPSLLSVLEDYLEEETADETCRQCGRVIGERVVVNPSVGVLCSKECLAEYWRENEEQDG